MRKKENTRKKQVFALSAAFMLMVSALVGSSYLANRRTEEAAKAREKTLNALSADTGSEDHSYSDADTSFADQVRSINTPNNSLVVMATGEPIGNDYGEVIGSVTSGNLTLAVFSDDNTAKTATEKLNESSISSAVDGNVFSIMDDGTSETAEPVSTADPAASADASSETSSNLIGRTNVPVVALIDTGDNTADRSVNFTSESDEDENGHGTRMDQLIRNAAGGNVRILSLKALKKDGTGSLSDVAAAMQYAINSGADIINMSIASTADGHSSAVLGSLTARAYEMNIKIVAAAGNSSSSTAGFLPAGLSGVIAVGAADENGRISSLSNYGDGTVYIKGTKYTSDAAATFAGYLADKDEVALADRDDILTEVTGIDSNGKGSDKKQSGKDFNVQASSQNLTVHIQYWNRTVNSYLDSSDVAEIGVVTMDDNICHYFTSTWSHNFGSRSDHNNAVVNSIRTFNGWVFENIQFTGTDRNYVNSTYHGDAYLASDTGTGSVPGSSAVDWIHFRESTATVYLDGGSTTSTGITDGQKLYSGGRDKTKDFGTPTRAGYTFTGWNITANYAGASFRGTVFTFGTSDAEVHATWSPNKTAVTLDAAGGTINGNSTLYFPSSGSNPSFEYMSQNWSSLTGKAMVKSGSKFLGFYDASGNQVYDSDMKAVVGTYWNSEKRWIYQNGGSLTLYAHWKSNVRTFDVNVALHTKGGDVPEYLFGINTVNNTKLVTFETWILHRDDNNTWVNVTSNPSDYCGADAHIGDLVELYNIKVQPGYTWNGGAPSIHGINGTPTRVNDTTVDTVIENGTDKVQVYLDLKPLTYNVHFDINSKKDGGNTPNYDQVVLAKGSMADQSFEYGVSSNLNDCGYTWEGHTFAGWNTKADGTGTWYGNKAAVAGIITPTTNGQTTTLYAQWTRNNSTVSIDANGGTYSGKTPVTQLWGTSLTVSDPKPKNETAVINYDYTDNGYFSGVTWSDDQTAGVTSSAVSSNQDSVGLVFSKWQVMTKDKSTDVPDGNGSWGFIVNGNNYIFGAYNAVLQARYYYQTVVLPTPKKDGYTFIGWYTDENWKTKAGNAGDRYSPKKNITLYARFRPDSYKYSDEVEVTMQDPPSDKDEAYVKIKKTDKNGNVLTKVNDTDFVIGISSGSVWTESNKVLELRTGTGVFDTSGKQLIGFDDAKHDKTLGWWDVTDLLEVGKTYTAHEISAPAGYTLDSDKTFTVTANSTTLAAAKKAYEQAEAALKRVTGSSASDATRNLTAAQDAYNKAKAAYDEARTERITIQFKDSCIIIPPESKPKKTAPDKTELGLVRFTLIDKTDGNKTVYTFKTGRDGKLPIDMYSHLVAGHQMEIKETAFAGFKAVDIEFYVPTNGDLKNAIPANIIDDAHTVKLKLKKVDPDGNALSGAEFKLYSKDENGNYRECRHNSAGLFLLPNDDPDSEYAKGTAYTAVTGNDGIASFEKINTRAFSTGPESTADSQSYYIKETKAPDGYSLMADYIKVTIPDEDKATVTYEVTVNESKATMISLQAGGKGTKMYILIGSAMIAAAGVYLTMHRKMQKN